jgi:hypothetical protein
LHQHEALHREEIVSFFHRLEELKENLSRKELYLQTKEKKWNDIEINLKPYADTMPEIFDLL